MLIFRERLIALREQHGFDQKDIGEKLYMSSSAYGFYEQGRNEPSLETLKKLAKIFQVSTDYLLGLFNTEEHLVYYSLPEEIVLSKSEIEVIKEMKNNSLLMKISANPHKNVYRLKR